MPKDAEGSLLGKGEGELLPPKGNPFAASLDSSSLPIPATSTSGAVGSVPDGDDREARDLTPEDVLALFGGTPTTPQPAAAIPATSVAAGSVPAMTAGPAPTPLMAVAAPARDPAPAGDPLSRAANASPFPIADTPAFPEVSAPVASDSAAAGAAKGEGLPKRQPSAPAEGDASEVRVFEAKVQLPGAELGGTTPFQPPNKTLDADGKLVDKILVTDARLTQLWLEIDAIEARLVGSKIGNIRLVQELLDRLQYARNYIMAGRANYEEAERLVAEVRYRTEAALLVRSTRNPTWILAYQVAFLALIVAGFIAAPVLAKFVGGLYGEKFDFLLLWITLMCGGVGGITGALHGLWTHVARDQDYDPQFDIWYITNPIMGVVLGAFVYLILAGKVVSFFADSDVIYYLLAWLTGFQQNLVFGLIKSVLDKFVPQAASTSKVSEGQTSAASQRPSLPAAGESGR